MTLMLEIHNTYGCYVSSVEYKMLDHLPNLKQVYFHGIPIDYETARFKTQPTIEIYSEMQMSVTLCEMPMNADSDGKHLHVQLLDLNTVRLILWCSPIVGGLYLWRSVSNVYHLGHIQMNIVVNNIQTDNFRW